MTSALKEIVDRYEALVSSTLDPFDPFDHDIALISRARAELERGVDVRNLLNSFELRIQKPGEPFRVAWVNEYLKPMADALRDAGVRVVEDGKESSDGK